MVSDGWFNRRGASNVKVPYIVTVTVLQVSTFCDMCQISNGGMLIGSPSVLYRALLLIGYTVVLLVIEPFFLSAKLQVS